MQIFLIILLAFNVVIAPSEDGVIDTKELNRTRISRGIDGNDWSYGEQSGKKILTNCTKIPPMQDKSGCFYENGIFMYCDKNNQYSEKRECGSVFQLLMHCGFVRVYYYFTIEKLMKRAMNNVVGVSLMQPEAVPLSAVMSVEIQTDFLRASMTTTATQSEETLAETRTDFPVALMWAKTGEVQTDSIIVNSSSVQTAELALPVAKTRQDIGSGTDEMSVMLETNTQTDFSITSTEIKDVQINTNLLLALKDVAVETEKLCASDYAVQSEPEAASQEENARLVSFLLESIDLITVANDQKNEEFLQIIGNLLKVNTRMQTQEFATQTEEAGLKSPVSVTPGSNPLFAYRGNVTTQTADADESPEVSRRLFHDTLIQKKESAMQTEETRSESPVSVTPGPVSPSSEKAVEASPTMNSTRSASVATESSVRRKLFGQQSDSMKPKDLKTRLTELLNSQTCRPKKESIEQATTAELSRIFMSLSPQHNAELKQLFPTGIVVSALQP